jgi:hypothetical protein
MITSFSDIQQFYVGEKIGIFLKKQKLAIVWTKNANFPPDSFGENIF